MRHRLVLSILLAAAVTPAPAAPSEGKFCLEDAPCLAASAHGADVTVSEKERTFTWTDANGRVTLGVIAAGAQHVTFTSPATIRVRLKSNTPDRWPAQTVLTIRGTDQRSWRIGLPTRQTKSGVDLGVAPGEYEIDVAVQRHRRQTRRVSAAASAVDVAILLQAVPQVGGRVVSGSKEPVPGAAVRINDDVVAVADGAGRFAFDADPDKWPETIAISAGGFGTVTLVVPRARANTDLLDIALSAGASIHVAVERATEIGSVRLELYKRRYDVSADTPLTSRSLGVDEKATTFKNIEGGEYLLLARGEKLGQRYGMKFTVTAAEEKSVAIALTPRQLTIRTEMAGAALPHAHIHLSNADGLWRDDFRAGSDGILQVSTWQFGKMTALVFAEGTMTATHREQHSFPDDDEAEWTIRVSTREARGRILDAKTEKPIANANVALQVKGAQRYTALTKTDGDGRFVFTAAVPGEHAINAAADGYQHGGLRYSFSENEEMHEVTLHLQPASSVHVAVRDEAGRPIAHAAVLDFVGYTLTGERFTNENGDVVIPVAPNEVRDAYVIPRDGSFAAVSIGTTPETTIRVPQPQATIVVSSLSTEQKPIPGVRVIMRYNGMAMPLEVQEMLARQQGASIVSGTDGRIVFRHMPLGIYEFWPIGSPTEARAAMSGLGKEAPVSVIARPGLNEAILSFAAAKRP